MWLSADTQTVAPPGYFTRFVGRAGLRALLPELVPAGRSAGSSRLLTLVGRGGAGKTRLAAQLVSGFDEFDRFGEFDRFEGVGWADLGVLAHADELPHLVGRAVGLPHGAGADLTRAIAHWLAPRRQLLVLDGCEVAAQACRALAETLLAGCPWLVIATTSRTELRSPLERVLRVRGLEPGPSRSELPSEAAQLFLDRAEMAGPTSGSPDLDLAAVDALCVRVGGSPLAIELLAPWADDLPSAQLLAVLGARGRRIRVPVVLAAVTAWLGSGEQRVLRALGSFGTEFTREAAEAVAGADLATLAGLTRRGLIARVADPEDATRYRMHPLVRRHALRQLDRDPAESAAVRDRHLDYCVSLATSLPGERSGHELLLPEVQAEFRAALDWGLATRAGRPVLSLLSAVHRSGARWNTAARFRTVVEAALELPEDGRTFSGSTARAGSLEAAGYAAAHPGNQLGDQDQAGRRFAEAAAGYLRLDSAADQARCLRAQGRIHLSRGELAAAASRLGESLRICRRTADQSGAAWSGLHLAELTAARGRHDPATSQILVAIKDFTQLGVPLGACRGYLRLADYHRAAGRPPEAVDAYGKALGLIRRWQFALDLGDLLAGLACIASELHRPDRSATLVGAHRAWLDAFGSSSLAGPHADLVTAERQVRLQLGDEDFAAALAASLGLDAAQALAEAELAVAELASLCRRLPFGVTEREVEVLRLVAEGLTNLEIAERLGLSPRTVHAHLRSTFGKLGVGARTAAVREAETRGLL